VESSCELGNEPLGSIKCWELPSGCTTCGLSSGTQLHRVSEFSYKMDVIFSFETPAHMRTTNAILKNCNINNYHCESLKSCIS
jgi:hypothetical protein